MGTIFASTPILRAVVSRPSVGVRQKTWYMGAAESPELSIKTGRIAIRSKTKKLSQKSKFFCTNFQIYPSIGSLFQKPSVHSPVPSTQPQTPKYPDLGALGGYFYPARIQLCHTTVLITSLVCFRTRRMRNEYFSSGLRALCYVDTILKT